MRTSVGGLRVTGVIWTSVGGSRTQIWQQVFFTLNIMKLKSLSVHWILNGNNVKHFYSLFVHASRPCSLMICIGEKVQCLLENVCGKSLDYVEFCHHRFFAIQYSLLLSATYTCLLTGSCLLAAWWKKPERTKNTWVAFHATKKQLHGPWLLMLAATFEFAMPFLYVGSHFQETFHHQALLKQVRLQMSFSGFMR
jgi:hypothetical protein